jgi:hypothetical protein
MDMNCTLGVMVAEWLSTLTSQLNRCWQLSDEPFYHSVAHKVTLPIMIAFGLPSSDLCMQHKLVEELMLNLHYILSFI